MNRELNIFGDRSVGRAALGRATGYSLKGTPLTPPKCLPAVRSPVTPKGLPIPCHLASYVAKP